MNTFPGKISLLVLIAAVLVYVIYNYAIGNSEPDHFVLSAAMLCLFLLQVGASLVRALRDRKK